MVFLQIVRHIRGLESWLNDPLGFLGRCCPGAFQSLQRRFRLQRQAHLPVAWQLQGVDEIDAWGVLRGRLGTLADMPRATMRSVVWRANDGVSLSMLLCYLSIGFYSVSYWRCWPSPMYTAYRSQYLLASEVCSHPCSPRTVVCPCAR
jgi:hypothetical protein